MNKVLVLGGKGQLGLSLNSVAPDFVFLGSEELNILDQEAVRAYFESHAYDYVINCSAYTAVDLAEDQVQQAFKLNAYAVEFLAQMSMDFGFKLIHISTDYVFSGSGDVPYKETDPVNPQTVYGQSKYKGEELLMNSGAQDYLIIRTSWLFSEFQNNFVKTMLRLSQTRDEVSVVDDQKGRPTYAVDLARFIVYYIKMGDKPSFNLLHFSNSGSCTWYDFAIKIFAEEGSDLKVTPISSVKMHFKAPRPSYSVLDLTRLSEDFAYNPRSWQEALKEMLSKL